MNWILRIALVLAGLIIIEFYFFRKVFNLINKLDGRYKKFLKVFSWVIVVWINIFPSYLLVRYVASIFSPGRIVIPENFFFDAFIYFPFLVGILYIVQSFIFLILIDAVKLILKIFRQNFPRFFTYANAATIIFFLLYSPIRIYYDNNFISINETEYISGELPADLKNFKIVFISDLQADRFTDGPLLDDYVAKVNSLEPDLILIGGDFITSSPNYIEKAAEYTSKMRAKHGIFSCVGDHDNWAYRGDYQRSLLEVKKALNSRGINMLDNENVELAIGNATIFITGATYTYVRKVNGSTIENLAKNKNGDLDIFLTHQPAKFLINTAADNNYDIFLAGHTHGGQISFVFPTGVYSPSLLETDYVKGKFFERDMMIYVTRGLGVSIIPVRFNSTPEITLIRLLDAKP